VRVGYVGIGAVGQQLDDYVGVAVACRQYQGRAAILIAGVDVYVIVQRRLQVLGAA
jgi:hypothetical protein